METAAAGDGSGVFAEQGADLVFLGGDGLLGEWYGDLSLAEESSGLADFELGADATIPAGGDEIQGDGATGGGAAGDSAEPLVVRRVP